MSEPLSISLRLELDEMKVQEWWEEYAADCAYYRDRGELSPGHCDPGYATGVPTPLDEYRAQFLASCLDEILGDHTGYSVVRSEDSQDG